ncbi:MAG: hypothetical protein OXF74_10485 [Rhodobacteraceae bacterium]|nr:hypothetical protein [Paracoccaceae bacterium]
MELLANDLSVNQQFKRVSEFREAFKRVMIMRKVARRYGSELLCHRAMLNATPIPNLSVYQAVMKFDLDSERRAAMTWLTKAGPYWDDLRCHSRGDWLECKDKIVTDSAVGEAAFRRLHGVDCGLVSFSPSDWNYAPVEVIWSREAEGCANCNATLDNWWTKDALEDALKNKTSIRSWDELRKVCYHQFGRLTFAKDCFKPLEGVPFAKSASEKILWLSALLDQLSQEFDAEGNRTKNGHRIIKDYFTGQRAHFSDSSTSEKNRFRSELTFDHPEDLNDTLFCTWHGKVPHLTLRLHFSWPIVADKPIYVVYAGPKITKK